MSLLLAQERWEVTIPTKLTSELVREVAADAPTFLGIGVETLTAAALGGGGVAVAFGAWKIFRRILSRDRKPQGAESTADPFPRRLDEARQQREIRQYSERRCPEFDAAVGRVFDDEFKLYEQQAPAAESSVLKAFYERIRGRVDRLMPPSTREYIEE